LANISGAGQQNSEDRWRARETRWGTAKSAVAPNEREPRDSRKLFPIPFLPNLDEGFSAPTSSSRYPGGRGGRSASRSAPEQGGRGILKPTRRAQGEGRRHEPPPLPCALVRADPAQVFLIAVNGGSALEAARIGFAPVQDPRSDHVCKMRVLINVTIASSVSAIKPVVKIAVHSNSVSPCAAIMR